MTTNKISRPANAVTFAPYVVEALERYLRSFKKAYKASGFSNDYQVEYYGKQSFINPDTNEPVKLSYFSVYGPDERTKVKGSIFGYDNNGNAYQLTANEFNSVDNQSILIELENMIARDIKENSEPDHYISRDEYLEDMYEQDAYDRERYG